MTATINNSTVYAGGTRVYVDPVATFHLGLAAEEVRGKWGEVISPPNDQGDYSVRPEGESISFFVSAQHVRTSEEVEGTEPETEPEVDMQALGENARVWIVEGARYSQGPVIPERTGRWGTTTRTIDSDGDYFISLEGDAGAAYTYVRWQDLRLEEPDSEKVANELRAAIAKMNAQWDALNEALNEKANDQDWCSEFESIVQPLGFTGRVPENKCYTVDVNVTFTHQVTYDDSSRDFDSHVRELLGGGSDLNSFTLDIEASHTASIHISSDVVRDSNLCCEDCIKEYIDESLVQSALDDEGVWYSSIEDYEVSSYEESTTCCY